MSTYLITGANRGIGLELTRQVLAAGHAVLAVVRSASPELSALAADAAGKLELLTGYDLGDDGLVERLGAAVGERTIDVAILNAGVLERQGAMQFDLASIRRQFEVNSMGPLRVMAAVHERLPKGGKVALVTSRMGSIADNGSGAYYGYRMSKSALNSAGMSLARDLAPRGVAVALLHPGFVRTEMTGGNGDVDAPTAAKNLLTRIDALGPDTSGKFWHANGQELPW